MRRAATRCSKRSGVRSAPKPKNNGRGKAAADQTGEATLYDAAALQQVSEAERAGKRQRGAGHRAHA